MAANKIINERLAAAEVRQNRLRKASYVSTLDANLSPPQTTQATQPEPRKQIEEATTATLCISSIFVRQDLP